MNLSRRRFLKIAGAAGAAGVASTQIARGSTDSPGRPEWSGMLTDLTLCVGCRKCEWACRRANGPGDAGPIESYDDPSVFQEDRRTNDIRLTVVNRHEPAAPADKPVFVKTQCMHCIEPGCASACLVGAYRKAPQGPVVYDPSACIGCRYCMVACPFEMPAYTYDSALSPVVRKCMMCVERVAAGARPACAEICPVEAITFGKRSDLIELARKKIGTHPDRYVKHIYGEYESGGTCWLYIAGRPFEKLGFPRVSTTPPPELTRGFLSAVPFVQTIAPAVLIGAYSFAHRRERIARGETEAGPATSTNHDTGSEP